MTTSSYSLRPSAHKVLLTFLVHHNPFYLLSALCMIAGCYALNSALGLYSGDLRQLLVLIGTINAYELVLIGLGLYLIRGRGILRDGRTLLLLQAVFLFDLTFLDAETSTAGLKAGLVVNAVLLALALLKVAAVLWGLSPRVPRVPHGSPGAIRGGAFPWRLFGTVSVLLVALFGIPVLFKWLDRDAAIAARHFYAVWWMVGLLLVVMEMQRRLSQEATQGAGGGDGSAGIPMALSARPRPRLGGVYVGTAFCSLLAHMAMMHWVYRVRFVPADMAPVLLGLAVALKRAVPSAAVPHGDLRMLRWLLPAAAVAVSFSAPPDLGFAFGRGGRTEVTPAMLAGAGAYLAYVYLYLLPLAAWFLAAGAAALVLVLFGPTWAEVMRLAGGTWRWSSDLAERVMPKTAVQWGLTAVGAAFAFLGLGAAVSLSQGKTPPAEPAPQRGPD